MLRLSRIAFLHPSLENNVADLATFNGVKTKNNECYRNDTLISERAKQAQKDEWHHEDIVQPWHPPHSTLYAACGLDCQNRTQRNIFCLLVFRCHITWKFWIQFCSFTSFTNRIDNWIFIQRPSHFHLQFSDWSLRRLIDVSLNWEECFFMPNLNVVKEGSRPSVICFQLPQMLMKAITLQFYPIQLFSNNSKARQKSFFADKICIILFTGCVINLTGDYLPCLTTKKFLRKNIFKSTFYASGSAVFDRLLK